MKNYFRIFKALIKINLQLTMAYRAEVFNYFVSTFGWGIFQIIWVYMITYKTPVVFGWKREEMILLAGAYITIIGIFHMFFSRNFERLSIIINRAELDTLLIKPVDSQFLISFWNIRLLNILRVGLGTVFIIFMLNKMNIQLTIPILIGSLVLIFFGVTLLYSIWFLISIILIWQPRLDNLIDLLFNTNGFARYPTEMLWQLKNVIVFIFIPFALSIVTPVRFLIRKSWSGDYFWLIFLSVTIFYLSRKFWQFALRFYTSASS